MRLLEFLLLFFLGLGFLRMLFASLKKYPPSPWFEFAAVLVLALQLIFEHYRWQMLPAYILLTMIVCLAWLLPKRGTGRPLRAALRSLMIALAGFLFLGSIALPALLPVPQLSPPSGPYGVGTHSWQWIDTTRKDPYAPNANSDREIMVQAWYPTELDAQGKLSPWMDAAEIVAPAVADWLELPSFFLDHLALVTSQTRQDAQPAKEAGGFPVLFFSHGYGGFRAQNTNQMQHLASYGFIILAIEHTYGDVVSVFPDGRVAYHNPDTLPDGLNDAEDLVATRALGAQWAGDLSFALDQFTALTGDISEAVWQGIADLSRVGAFGHSTGGGAAIEFCFRDSRCTAILTLDPFVKPVSQEALDQGLQHLALHMFSEAWSSTDNLERFAPLVQHSDPQPVVVTVSGSDHYDFSDLPLLSPLAHQIGLKGPINGQRMAVIVNAYLLDYFDSALRGKTPVLLTNPALDFPEVMFQGPIGHP
ncbi:MAG: hypothetical protein E4G99_05245 [Anaerolineales bacterium]|nr:MAG: hypothetical protein E4G99_05245 [Anaerolineales bacterium]